VAPAWDKTTQVFKFVAMTRSRISSKCLIEPSARFDSDSDFSVFGKGYI
jgi:hypothetical protein